MGKISETINSFTDIERCPMGYVPVYAAIRETYGDINDYVFVAKKEITSSAFGDTLRSAIFAVYPDATDYTFTIGTAAEHNAARAENTKRNLARTIIDTIMEQQREECRDIVRGLPA